MYVNIIKTSKFTIAFQLLSLTTILSAPQGDDQADLTYIGDLTKTQHDVSGKVSILDQDTLVIDEFSYDGNGFGVYINVATEGKNLRDYKRNRIDVPYPSGSQVSKNYVPTKSSRNVKGQPIEKRYNGDEQLVIDLKQVGVEAKDVKWLSVWCTVFEISFGHVEF